MPGERLRQIAALVRPGRVVADSGTDHAYLPVALVKSGRCPRAVACDLREGPLENARRPVAEAGLADRIACRLGNGLSPVAEGEAEEIVVAGMGGETIASILEACPYLHDPRYHLLLQPMTRPEELRRFLMTHGFSIESETVAEEPPHLYTVLSVYYTGCAPETDETRFYRGALCGETGRRFLERQLGALRKKYEGLAAGGGPAGEREQLARLIAALEETV